MQIAQDATGAAGAETDPNLQLQTQQKAATTSPSGTPSPIPAPPPLPTAPASNSTAKAPSSPTDTTPSTGVGATVAPAIAPPTAATPDPTIAGAGTISAPGAPVSDAPPAPTGGAGSSSAPPPPPPLLPGATLTQTSGTSAVGPGYGTLANPTSDQLSSGVNAYGRMWKPGEAPPAGLSDAQLSQWQQMHPTNIGYAPTIWSALQSGAPIQNADGSLAAGITPIAPIAPTGNAAGGGQQYLEGGQYFNDVGQATDAMNASNKQMAGGGSPILAPQAGGTYTPDVAALLAKAPAAGGSSSTLSPSGSASDVGGGSTPIGTSVPLASSTPPGATTGGPYTPSSVAIGSTILPNGDPRLSNLQSLVDNAAGSLGSVDRTKLAESMFDQFASATDPAYQQALREAKQTAFGNGQGGSADERDLYRNTFTTRQAQLDNQRQALENNALEGSIADQFNKVSALSGLEGQAYGENADTNNQLRTERGYQGSLEEQAFQRALEQYQTEQNALNSSFQRGVTLEQLGNEGNPAAFIAQMASQYGVDPSVIAALAAQSGAKSVPPPPPLS